MAKLNFTKESAKVLADFYRTRDVVAQRAAMVGMLSITPGCRVIDIGSGPGFLCNDLAHLTGPSGQVLGIDISSDLIEFSQQHAQHAWQEFQMGDATALPAPDHSFDVAVCAQVAEYIPDVEQVVSEIYRVLAPGGQALVVATDWDALAWHSEVPDRMARVMTAWEAHCAHSRLPRRLGPLLRDAGFEAPQSRLFPLINMEFEPQGYSYGISKLIKDFVIRGHHIDADEAEAWYKELASLSEAGQYYFTSGRVMFLAEKPS